MKKLIPLFALIALAAPLTAQDVALIDIRFKSDKSVRKVALEFHEQDAPHTPRPAFSLFPSCA